MAKVEDLAKARLISRDSSFIGVEETVHGCTASFAAFATAVLGGDAEAIKTAEAAVTTHLLELETVQLRQRQQLAVGEGEKAHYDTVHSSIAAAMSATEGDIAALKAQLAQERRERKNRMEYEAMAGTVAQLPGREVLRKRTREAEATLAAEEAELEKVQGALAQRQQQFALLMGTLADLQSALTLEASAGTAAAGDGVGDEDGDVSLTE